MKKTKMSNDNLPKTNTELIIYQIGEIKNLLTEAKNEWKGFRDDIDKRVTALEIWRAAEEERARANPSPKLDLQKIILAALGIASAAIALALALVQGGLIK